MKYLIVLLFVLGGFTTVLAQQQYFKVSNPQTGEVYAIDASKKVRVVTKDGKRYKDRLIILDENTIALKGDRIPISQIDKIKRMGTPLVVIIGVFAVYYGVAMAAGGIVLAVLELPAAGAVLGVAGLGLTYAGITGINPARGFKAYRGWEFSIDAY
jgi:hypothetical protein